MTNRIKTEIKAGILQAFEQVGGVDYLVEIARRDPPTFCRLLAQVLPTEIKAEINTRHTLDLGQAMIEASQRLEAIEHKP
ncbi:MAG: hypothetical protein O2817_09990 [Proteobacteria bacterium]|nr:hypothetical protein [Pseudomonadota bacterium]